MNEKEISEIRRRFRADKSNITHVRGCYVNEKQEIVSQFDQPLSLLPQEECENMLSVLRRTLSGTLGKNLIEMPFTTAQVVDSDEHRLLMALRDSKLTDEEAVRMLSEKKEKEAQKIIKQFPENPDMQILNGRYGPYIAYQKKNYKIPENVNPADLNLDACFKVIELQAQKAEMRKAKGAKAKTKK